MIQVQSIICISLVSAAFSTRVVLDNADMRVALEKNDAVDKDILSRDIATQAVDTTDNVLCRAFPPPGSDGRQLEQGCAHEPTGTLVKKSSAAAEIVSQAGWMLGYRPKKFESNVNDKFQCAEFCKKAVVAKIVAKARPRHMCCVHTVDKKCWVFPGATQILDKVAAPHKFSAADVAKSVTGSATVCSPQAVPQGRNSSFPDQNPSFGTRFDNMFSSVSWSGGGQGKALFRQIEPQSVRQGGLGDCWLLSAMANVARYESAVRGLFVQQFRSTDGEYDVKLFNLKTSRWGTISIDDSLPTIGSRIVYGQLAADGALWPLLLEKATAKLFLNMNPSRADSQKSLHGTSYSSIASNNAKFGLTLLTGCTHFDVIVIHATGCPASNPNCRFTCKAHLTYDANELRGYRMDTSETGFSDDAGLWRTILKATDEDRLMTGGILQKKDVARKSGETEAGIGEGLYDGHGYTVFQGIELDPAKLTLVCWEEITVDYASKAEYDADKARLKEFGPGKKRLQGGMWEESRARRAGVHNGWMRKSYTLNRRMTFLGVRSLSTCTHATAGSRKLYTTRMSVASLSQTTKLIQVRNPWGNEKEFTGKWSDADPAWAHHIDVQEAIGFVPAADGFFWMSYEDFVKYFSTLDIMSEQQCAGGIRLWHP